MLQRIAFPQSVDVHVTGVNARREKHGKDRVPAVDVRLQLTGPNTLLDQLKGPELRAALYMAQRGAEPPQQAEIDGVATATDTPNLRVDGLAPLHLEGELTGYTVVFDVGTGRKDSVVELGSCKLNDWAVTALPGGSVILSWRVQSSGLDKRAYGELCMLIDAKVGVQLHPPVVTQKTIDEAAAGAPAGEADADVDFRKAKADKAAGKPSRIAREIGKAERKKAAEQRAAAELAAVDGGGAAAATP